MNNSQRRVERADLSLPDPEGSRRSRRAAEARPAGAGTRRRDAASTPEGRPLPRAESPALRRFPLVVLGCFLCALLPVLARRGLADDWPFFRGPHHNGVSGESGWTTHWPAAGPKIAWSADVGTGVSSVVVSGDRAITMGNRGNVDVVSCFDASSGEVLWRFEYPCPFAGRQFEGGTASTPTIAGSLVFTLSYDGQAHCLRLEDGKPVWEKHLVDDLGGRYASWKYAGSPLVAGELVILDTGAERGSTVALDARTGRKVWASGQDLPGYATPIPFEHDGKRGVLVFKARALVAHELASGRELWRVGWKTYYDCNASTPSVSGDRLFISTGYGGRSARGALFELGTGAPRQIWLNQDIETKMNSAVLLDDHGYAISEKGRGQLMCFDLRDGSIAWTERSFAKYGTLMIADRKLIILDEKGELVIAEASPDGYRELARARVLGSRSWVMPVLANGRIYARSNRGRLVCLDVRAGSGDGAGR